MSIARTHRIAVYQPPTQGDPYAPGDGYTKIADDIPANLQPLGGDVRQTAAGRKIDAQWRGFVAPEHTDAIREDRVVVLTEGVGPRTYRIRSVAPQGGRWDTEFLLGVSAEEVS